MTRSIFKRSKRPHRPTALAGFFLFILLFALPLLLFSGALRSGAVPYFMDTLMYFVPLRVHAARLVAGGDWPLWNRCLMAGAPLFENPQSALAYPPHWPSLFWPGGAWFTAPLLAHLGLWAALTFWALRRIGARRGPALFGGALALAGSYGWSRLQFGNYLNVLPWWPLWLGAGHAFAAAGGALWLFAGSAAVALALLAGAHQLAAYGLAGLAVYGLTQLVLARGRRLRWLLFLVLSFAFGIALAAPGWLPQLGFIRETSRPQGLAARDVLRGAIGSWSELARALTGDWQLVTPHPPANPAGPWSDAESQATLGLAALALAALMPRRRPLRRAWLGCWLAALTGVALSLRVVNEPLLDAFPQAGLFHDPRRWLGLSQAMLILAAALGAAARWPRPQNPRALVRLTLRLLPPVVLIAAVAAAQVGAAPRYTALSAALALLLTGSAAVHARSLSPSAFHRALRIGYALALTASVALLGHATWVTTDLKMIPLNCLLHPAEPPLIERAGLNPGQRFFTIDWQPAVSYDYTRPDLADWALPNLACLWGREDLGGYEPAQSERYRAFMKRLHQAEPWRQTVYAQHFGLVGVAASPALDEANVRAAILPRWGLPSNPLPGRPLGSMVYPRGYTTNFAVTALLLDPAGPAGFSVAQGGNLFRYPLSAPHPLSARDDLAASTATYAGPRPAPPFVARVQAASADLPPQFGEPLPWELSLTPPTRLLGVYTWGSDLARLWRPVRMSEMALLMRTQGDPHWTSWLSGEGEVLTRTIAPNRLTLDVSVKDSTATTTARLVIHDAWWPGWHATVDGRPAPILQESLWRALDLPPGRHAIEMQYAPPAIAQSLKICAASGISLVGLCLLWGVVGIVKRRRI